MTLDPSTAWAVLLALLPVLGALAVGSRRPATAAALLAVAALIKVYPGVLLVLLLRQRESRARVVLTAEAEERLGGPVWYSYATAERIVGDRYPLYREPPRHLVEV